MNLNACCEAQRRKKFLKLDRHELQVEELLFIDLKKKFRNFSILHFKDFS